MHVDELRPEREEHLSLTMLPLDVLHNILLQRGIGARELCALESTCLMFRQLVDEAAWQHAFKERPGTIINIASVGGVKAGGLLGVYNTTKAAIIHLTSQLASELGPTRVVGIAPGLVKTDFAQVLVDNFGDQLAARLPTRRLGEPEDIANLAVFLASDQASWITAETYVIDGGSRVAEGAVG